MPDIHSNKNVLEPSTTSPSKKPPPSFKSPKQKAFPKPQNQLQRCQPFFECGLINMGNTCYVNSILQALSSLPNFCTDLFARQDNVSTLAKSFQRMLSLRERRSSPLDPSSFLKVLEQKISSIKAADFHINTQQDAAEMLEYLLPQLFGTSSNTEDTLDITFKTCYSCSNCHQGPEREERLQILQIPVSGSIEKSIQKLLESEILAEENPRFCDLCTSWQPAIIDYSIVDCSRYLILHLKRFSVFEDNFCKDINKVVCVPDILSVPVKVGEDVCFHKKYTLVATINHSGTLDRGHYTSFVKSQFSAKWYHCNDKAVVEVDQRHLNNETSYILFYQLL